MNDQNPNPEDPVASSAPPPAPENAAPAPAELPPAAEEQQPPPAPPESVEPEKPVSDLPVPPPPPPPPPVENAAAHPLFAEDAPPPPAVAPAVPAEPTPPAAPPPTPIPIPFFSGIPPAPEAVEPVAVPPPPAAEDVPVGILSSAEEAAPSGGGWNPAAGEQLLGRYMLQEKLSSSSDMGVVFQCTDSVRGIPVVLRVLPAGVSGNELALAHYRTAFERVSQLHGEHIATPRIFEQDAARGESYVLSDFAAGETLGEWGRQQHKAGNLSLKTVLNILRPVADALDDAHQQGVFHQSLTPDYVMVDENGWIKIRDFELAAVIRANTTATAQKAFIPYKAPELWQGQPATAATDQYALAVILYELLGGAWPYTKEPPSSAQFAVDQPRLREPLAWLPPWTQNALLQALSQDPKKRFATCRDFVEAMAHKQRTRKQVVGQIWMWVILLAVVAGVGFGLSQRKDAAHRRREALRREADSGDRVAQNRLGLMYAYGQGIPTNNTEAFQWFMKSARQGYAEAQNNLGWMYANGRGTFRDDIRAMTWYKRAALQGDATAQFNVGWMYDQNRGVDAVDVEQGQAFRHLAASGVRTAALWLDIRDLCEGSLLPAPLAAADWYGRAAEQNHAGAQNNLGELHANGRLGETNNVEAIKWFRLAAEQGYTPAERNLGSMYADGRGTRLNTATAIQWFRKAADKNDAYSQTALGTIYHSGASGTTNDVEAVKWYRRAAQQHYAPAETALGRMYEKGLGVVQNYTEAAKWYALAAEQDYAPAQNNLATLTVWGRGVPVASDKTAMELYYKAAIQDYAPAQNNLAWMYEQGRSGLKADQGFDLAWAGQYLEYMQDMFPDYELPGNAEVFMALYWYSRAADQGLVNAQEALRRLK